ncbi:MAG: hemin uptake protein HemP [Deltaproteobacteria bacterium]|nr:hemin uptake protein HemP [Deltaproteobacteria bacterium]
MCKGLETDIAIHSFVKKLHPDMSKKLHVLMSNKPVIRIDLIRKDPEDILAIVSKNGNLVNNYKLIVGDTLSIEHAFSISVESIITDDQIFPIEFEYRGQRYYLNKTNQGKLILTK